MYREPVEEEEEPSSPPVEAEAHPRVQKDLI